MIGLLFRLFGFFLMVVGLALLVVAAVQHVDGLFGGFSHLAIYLGVAGVVCLAPGAWLAFHRRGD